MGAGYINLATDQTQGQKLDQKRPMGAQEDKRRAWPERLDCVKMSAPADVAALTEPA